MRRTAILGLTATLLTPALAGVAGAAPGHTPNTASASAATDPAPTANLGDPPAFTATSCMSVTDSVLRLYTAYFTRQPDESGFGYWVSEYANGARNLQQISEFFTGSTEFQSLYGSIDNAQFIDLVYQNVLGRAPEAEGRAYWIKRLDSISRGELMLSFSESEEYIGQTETAVPTAGFFGWYPTGTTWLCANGQSSVQKTSDLNLDVVYQNTDDATALFELYITDGTGTYLAKSWSIEPGYLGMVSYDNVTNNFDSFKVVTPDTVFWGLVQFPTPLPDQRAGWVYNNEGKLVADMNADTPAGPELYASHLGWGQ